MIDATGGWRRTAPAIARQAGALAAFLRDGLKAELTGETILFWSDAADDELLVELAPTREVRLVGLPPHRPDLMAEALAAAARGGEIALALAAAGTASAELVTRLACRTGGAVLTDALDLEVAGDRLRGRANVYSAHLRGRFELSARPWCVTLDPCWNDERRAAADPGVTDNQDAAGVPGAAVTRAEHVVLSQSDATAGALRDTSAASPFADLELLEAPPTGDLAGSRFLVVAGYGAADRGRLERIARAARRLGADFGVSRPVVTNGWAPADRLIGVSGSRAAPDLCLVVGASGAPALYWGIERAGFIVAVNPDEHAPVARNADVVVRDDGVALVEELADLLGLDDGRGRPESL